LARLLPEVVQMSVIAQRSPSHGADRRLLMVGVVVMEHTVLMSVMERTLRIRHHAGTRQPA